MAGRYTDEERRARGQYQDESGQWYTSSGYKVTEGGQNVVSEPTSVRQTAQPAPAAAPIVPPAAQPASALTGSYGYYDAAIRREAQQQAESELQRQAGEAAIRLLEDRRAAAALAAERAARQAYIAHMYDQKRLAQQLAAQGASGGMTDTAYLRLLAGYENRRGEILAQRDRDLLDLDRQIDARRIETQRAVLAAQREEAADAAETAGQAPTGTSAGRTGVKAVKSASKSGAKANAAAQIPEEEAAAVKQATASDLFGAFGQTPFQRAENERIDRMLRDSQLTQAQARALREFVAKLSRAGA